MSYLHAPGSPASPRLPRGGARRPQARIRELETELVRARAQIVTLEAALRQVNVEPEPTLPAWMLKLTGCQLAMVMAMYRAYPRPLSNFDLDEIAPRYDRVEDRDVRGMSVQIFKLRKKVGDASVVNIWGRGYVLSAEFRAKLKRDLDDAL